MTSSDRRRVLLLIGLYLFSALLLVRVHGPRVFFIAMGDDEVYYAHARSIAVVHNFRYENVPLGTFGTLNDGRLIAARYSIGPGILLSPFVWTGHLLAKLFEPEASQSGEITATDLLSACCGSMLFGLAGFLFLYGYLRSYFDEESSFWAVALVAFSSPLLYYLFRRPLMAHACEFFALSAAFFGVSRLRSSSGLNPVILTAIASGFIFLSRWQDFPFVIAISWMAIVALGDRKKSFLFAFILLTVLSIQAVFWKMMTGYLHPGLGRLLPTPAGDSLLFALHPWFFRHLSDIFVGKDWGILFLSPIVLLIGWLSFITRGEQTRQRDFLYLLIPSLVLVWMTANWISFGGEYANRYLIGLWIFFSFQMASCLQVLRLTNRRRLYRDVLLSGSGLLIYSGVMLSLFKSNTTDLTLHIATTPYGGSSDWVNPTFAWSAFKTMSHDPLHVLMSFGSSAGGYMAFYATKGLGLLPQSVLEKAQAYIEKHGIPNWYNSCLIAAWLLVGTSTVYGLFLTIFRRRRLV